MVWAALNSTLEGNAPVAAEPDAATRRRALDGFFRGIEGRAYRIAELATGRPDDALDLVQDSMLGFVKHYADKPPADWPALFYSVLDSRIRDWHRRDAVRRRWRVWFQNAPDEDEPTARVPGPEREEPGHVVAASAQRQALLQALRALPDRQRQAFLLRIWEGFDVATTARVMGCSPGSVKVHLFRAMAALRKHLEEHR
jgi:RNA polymerase sigma-70 factor (ECF subfamily)